MDCERDPLRAARGIFWGLVWSLVFWALLVGIFVL
jgi:hypothetical protein